MHLSLFERVSYEDLAERNATVAGSVRVGDCGRLEGLAGEGGTLALEAVVSRHPQGVHLEGTVRGEVSLECRRCLGPVPWHIERRLDLLVVGSEDAMRALPDEVEAHHAPALAGQLVDVLQEEVLLALPDHPAHEPGQCAAPGAPAGIEVIDQAAAEDGRDAGMQTQRPFAVLDVLKKRQQGDRRDDRDD